MTAEDRYAEADKKYADQYDQMTERQKVRIRDRRKTYVLDAAWSGLQSY